MSLRKQINLLISVVMLLFVTALAYLEIDASRHSIQEEMEAATRVTVHLLSSVVQSWNETRGGVTPRFMVGFLEHLGRVRAHQITLYNAAGEKLYGSPPSTYKAGRSAPIWFSRLVSPILHPVQVQVGLGTLEIVPDASRSVIDAWDDLLNLFWLSLALFVLINLLVFWFSSRAFHPVKDIIAGLRRMAQGEFQTRLPAFKVGELDAISGTFNRMAEAVEESFAVKKKAEQTAHALEENRALTQLIQRHLEEERRNLALELHDEIGQSVTAVRSIAASLVNRSHGKYPDIEPGVKMIVDVSGQMYDAMHGMVRRLRPMALEKLGLREAIQELVDGHGARNPTIDFDLQIEGDLQGLDEATNIAIYRVVQECLTNIVRHAEASHANIVLTGDRANGQLQLTISDNGKGIRSSEEEREEHFGLLGMRERVEGLGGKFDLENTRDRGVSVHVLVPLKVKQEKALNE